MAGLQAAGLLMAGLQAAGPLIAGPQLAGPLMAGPLMAGPLMAGPQMAGPQMDDGWAWLADGWAADRVGLLTAKAAALSSCGPRCPSSPLRWVIRVRAAALPSQCISIAS